MVLRAQKMPQANSITQVQVYENVMIDPRIVRGNTNSVYYKQKHDPNFKMPNGYPLIRTKEPGRGRRQSAVDQEERDLGQQNEDSGKKDHDRTSKQNKENKNISPHSQISPTGKNGDSALQRNSQSNMGQSKTLLQTRSPLAEGRKRHLIKGWSNRESKEVWVEDNIRLQTDILPRTDCIVQTDPLPPRPLPNLEYKFNYGIDCSIQVVESEIFNFEEQVQPLVNILRSRIVHESLTEVNQELQLQTMQNIQFVDEQTKIRRKAKLNEFTLENRLSLKKEKEAIAQQTQIHNQALVVHQKLTSMSFAKEYLATLKTETQEIVERLGSHSDHKLAAVKEEYGDFLFQQVMGHLSVLSKSDGFVDRAFGKVMANIMSHTTPS